MPLATSPPPQLSYTLIPQLTDLLGALKCDVLKPYENTLDKPEFFRLYRFLIRPAKLQARIFHVLVIWMLMTFRGTAR
jgi:hypothetical protein